MSGGNWETRIPGWLWQKKCSKIWWNLLNLSKKNFTALKLKNFNDEINNFFMNGCCSKIRNYVNLIISLNEKEELKKFQSSTFDTIERRRLVEDQDTILQLTGKIQDLQNVINCMNGSNEFSGCWISPEWKFPPLPILEGMLSRSFGVPSRWAGPPSIWDTHGISGNVVANPVASSSAPYPQELNPWSSGREEPIHPSTVEKSEKQTPVQDQRCQPGQSAKNSVIFSGGDSSKNYAEDQQRLQISDLHFDKFTTPATFACWKIRFKSEVCTCSQFRTEAMHWIKEVQMVDSVDELRSSSSTRGISMPNFLRYLMRGLLRHWIKYSRIPSSKKNQSGGTKRPRSRTVSFAEDRLLTWSTITSGSLEPTILSRTTPTYSLFFEMMIFRNSIQSGTEFYCPWRKSPDDILEGLYK